MATLETRLRNLATRIGTEFKSIRTLLNGNAADLSALTTTAKTNIVAAINELVTTIAGKQASLGFTPENGANKGQPNGYAGLDSGGKVPAAQLPSYVDDVVEAANFAALPATGEAGKLYIAIDTGAQYRWGGSAYAQLVSSPGTTDAVTEGSVNKYFTNARAKAAMDPYTGDTDANLVAEFEAALV